MSKNTEAHPGKRKSPDKSYENRAYRKVPPRSRGSFQRWHVLAVLTAVILLPVVLAVFFLGGRSPGSSSPTPAGGLSPIAKLSASDYHSLAVSPKDSDRVWFGSHNGIQESADGGKTWHPLAGMHADAMNMAMPATDPVRIYIAGHDVLKRRTDSGSTWEDMQTDLPGTDLHGFAVDPTNSQHVYALVASQGLFESKDGGSHWQPVPAQPPGATGPLAIIGGSPPALYSTTGLGLMRSQDGGNSWHPAGSGLPEGNNSIHALLSVPDKPQELYAGASDGLYHTTNAGATWQRIALNGQGIVALAASQAGPLRVYALTREGALFRLEGADLGNS